MPERPKSRPIASGHALVPHRDDRFGDQREAAAQARLLPGGGSGSQGDPLRCHGQGAYFLHPGSASSPGAFGQKAEPRGATEVLPDHQAGDDLDLVSQVVGAEVRQLRMQDGAVLRQPLIRAFTANFNAGHRTWPTLHTGKCSASTDAVNEHMSSPGVGAKTLAVERKRRRRRAGKSSGGSLASLRGGFRSVAHGIAGKERARPASRTRRVLGNVVTVVLLLVAAGLLLRRFGLLHR